VIAATPIPKKFVPSRLSQTAWNVFVLWDICPPWIRKHVTVHQKKKKKWSVNFGGSFYFFAYTGFSG
jgi:hypothetical protein